MRSPFIGNEAVAAGLLTPYELRSRYTAIFPNVYIARGADISATLRAHAAWLWSRRSGVVAGRSAAALHGAKWVSGDLPAEILWQNRRPPSGLRTWLDAVAPDEIAVVGGTLITTPARTAFDIACRYPLDAAVAAIDALARATKLEVAAIAKVAHRYRGRRGIRTARSAIALVDAAAESPRETWLRLLLIRQGFPRPVTQIPVYDEYGQRIAVFDMGWEHLKIAVDYDGDHHRTSRNQFYRDIRRAEAVANLGWILLRVTVEDTEGAILHRVGTAFARRA